MVRMAVCTPCVIEQNDGVRIYLLAPIAVKSKGNADKFQANGKMSEMWCHVNVIQIE